MGVSRKTWKQKYDQELLVAEPRRCHSSFFYGINLSFTIYSITDNQSKALQAEANRQLKVKKQQAIS